MNYKLQEKLVLDRYTQEEPIINLSYTIYNKLNNYWTSSMYFTFTE